MSRPCLVSVLLCGGLLGLPFTKLLAADAPTVATLTNGPASAPGSLAAGGLMLLLAVATFASEDAACIGAGMLVAQGHLGFAPAVAGCGAGIMLGDLGLFFAGRLIGRPIVGRWPFRRLISPANLAASTAWLEARGSWVILVSRFAPGTRLITYVAAGVLGVRTGMFVRAFAVATILWTPLLVGGSAVATAWSPAALHRPGLAGGMALLGVLIGALHLARPLATHAGRRRLLAVWRRVTRWEFWPPWVFYPPVLAWIVLLMVRHRSATLFTAANPGMPAGGFVGESKSDILRALRTGGAPVAPFGVLGAGAGPDVRVERASSFAADHGWPVVVKPDQGQRGTGVRILRSATDLRAAAGAPSQEMIVQAYVPGVEFGIFYARRLHQPHGRIVSATRKELPAVVGDGRRTLGQLILDDARTVAMWRMHSAVNGDRLHTIVPEGACIQLGDVGSHCRGAVFMDAHGLVTPALVTAIDRASQAMPGFYFGRFDLRSASVDDLRAGRFTIIELNGVTSEPTHIYDPSCSVLAAYRTLAASWSLAFAIGAEQAAAGARVWRLRELAKLVFGYRRFARASIAVTSPP